MCKHYTKYIPFTISDYVLYILLLFYGKKEKLRQQEQS